MSCAASLPAKIIIGERYHSAVFNEAGLGRASGGYLGQLSSGAVFTML